MLKVVFLREEDQDLKEEMRRRSQDQEKESEENQAPVKETGGNLLKGREENQVQVKETEENLQKELDENPVREKETEKGEDLGSVEDVVPGPDLEIGVRRDLHSGGRDQTHATN